MDLEQISTITRGTIIVVGALLTATGFLLLWLKGIGPVGARAALNERRLGISEEMDRARATWRRISLPVIIFGVIAVIAAFLI